MQKQLRQDPPYLRSYQRESHRGGQRPALKVHHKVMVCVQECAGHYVAVEEKSILRESRKLQRKLGSNSILKNGRKGKGTLGRGSQGREGKQCREAREGGCSRAVAAHLSIRPSEAAKVGLLAAGMLTPPKTVPKHKLQPSKQ